MMSISVSMIALSSQLVVSIADGVPVFDVGPELQTRRGGDDWT
jgi:hypothetical protein